MEDDVLIWPDGFWCFREEFRTGYLRDDNYREVQAGSAEWVEITTSPQAWYLRPN